MLKSIDDFQSKNVPQLIKCRYKISKYRINYFRLKLKIMKVEMV